MRQHAFIQIIQTTSRRLNKVAQVNIVVIAKIIS